MENQKHTQGKWGVESPDEFDTGHSVYLRERGMVIGRRYIAREIEQGEDDGLADAKLIAQSPDMYIFLTNFVEAIDDKDEPTILEMSMYKSAKKILKATE